MIQPKYHRMKKKKKEKESFNPSSFVTGRLMSRKIYDSKQNRWMMDLLKTKLSPTPCIRNPVYTFPDRLIYDWYKSVNFITKFPLLC